jgi:hypothetical protein
MLKLNITYWFNSIKIEHCFGGQIERRVIMDMNGNLTSVDTYDSDFSLEEIEAQSKEHFASMNKITREEVVVDFTDDEFRGMLGYVIGYTSYDPDGYYKELRDALVEEIKFTTGKDLTKCWIWNN